MSNQVPLNDEFFEHLDHAIEQRDLVLLVGLSHVDLTTPFVAAVAAQWLEAVERLPLPTSHHSVLSGWMRSPNVNMLTLLLSKGVDLRAIDEEELTVIHQCCICSDDIRTLEILLNFPSPINAQDDIGYTPLHIAANELKPSFAALLLERGARTDIENIWGQTPLLVAAKKGSAPLCEMLIEHGADVQHQDNQQRTALDHATEAMTFIQENHHQEVSLQQMSMDEAPWTHDWLILSEDPGSYRLYARSYRRCFERLRQLS